MSNDKFAGGEWCVNMMEGYTEVQSGGKVVCSLYGLVWGEGLETCCESIASDAHLISAAPDMYRALQGIASEIFNMNEDGFFCISLTEEEVEEIEAALAKADGVSYE